MKEILEQLGSKYLFKTFYAIDKSHIYTKKHLKIFTGVDLKDFYHLIFDVEQKSHFLLKHAQEIMALREEVITYTQRQYKYQHLILHATLCSKARRYLENAQWKVLSL